MHEVKLENKPGPGQYDHKSTLVVSKQGIDDGSRLKAVLEKTEKVCAFIEEAQFRGMSTPPPKYEVNYVPYS